MDFAYLRKAVQEGTYNSAPCSLSVAMVREIDRLM